MDGKGGHKIPPKPDTRDVRVRLQEEYQYLYDEYGLLRAEPAAHFQIMRRVDKTNALLERIAEALEVLAEK